MLTVEEIVSLAVVAASGGRKVVFQSLAREVGVVGRPGGWIYLPGGTKPVAHGWQAFAQLLSGSRVGFTGRDLLVEMSKASVSPADLAAAEREAHAMNVTPASAARGHDQGVVAVDDEFAEAYMDAMREYNKRARAEPALVTLTATDIEAVADRLLDELGKLGLSTPIRVGTIPLARCLGRALATVHIAVEQ